MCQGASLGAASPLPPGRCAGRLCHSSPSQLLPSRRGALRLRRTHAPRPLWRCPQRPGRAALRGTRTPRRRESRRPSALQRGSPRRRALPSGRGRSRRGSASAIASPRRPPPLPAGIRSRTPLPGMAWSGNSNVHCPAGPRRQWRCLGSAAVRPPTPPRSSGLRKKRRLRGKKRHVRPRRSDFITPPPAAAHPLRVPLWGWRRLLPLLLAREPLQAPCNWCISGGSLA